MSCPPFLRILRFLRSLVFARIGDSRRSFLLEEVFSFLLFARTPHFPVNSSPPPFLLHKRIKRSKRIKPPIDHTRRPGPPQESLGNISRTAFTGSNWYATWLTGCGLACARHRGARLPEQPKTRPCITWGGLGTSCREFRREFKYPKCRTYIGTRLTRSERRTQ